MPNSKRGNKPKSDVAEEDPGGAAAIPQGEAAEVARCDPNGNVVLAAIASLRFKLDTKSDICDMPGLQARSG